MKNYELLYIVSSNITPQEVKTVFDEVNKSILELKGKILETPRSHPFLRADAQGQNKDEQQSLADLPVTKKRLAYPIDKNKNGYYLLNNIGLEADKIIELDKKIKLIKNVLRYLIIKAEPMSQKEVGRLKQLAERRRKEKDGKKEIGGTREKSKRIEKPPVISRAPIKIKESEESKESEKSEDKPAEPEKLSETKKEKEAQIEKAPEEKKKVKSKKIKLDDLEKKLDKILDETII